MNIKPLLMALPLLLCIKPLLLMASSKKVTFVRSSSLVYYDQALAGFYQRLQEKKIDFSLDNQLLPEAPSRMGSFVQQIINNKPDLVLMAGSMASRTVRERVKTVPSVFCMVIDPSGSGLTYGGVSLDLEPSVQIQFIRSHFPRLQKIGVIYNPLKNKEIVKQLLEMQQRGDRSLTLVQARSAEEMEPAIASLHGKVDCLLMAPDPVLYAPQMAPQLILHALKHNIPLIAISPAYVKSGALLALYPDYKEAGYLAGEIAEQIWGGADVSRLPLRWLQKFRISINLAVAQRLGIGVGNDLIQQAEEVVKNSH